MKNPSFLRLLPRSLALAGLAALAAATARAESFFQFGVFAPNVQLVDASEDVKGLRIDFVYGENANVSGLDLGFVNVTKQDFVGVGYGLVNYTEGDAKGLQWTWIYGHTGGQFTGWQSGLVAHIGGADSAGLQAGWLNFVDKDFTGVQFGLLNKATQVSGVQLGFVNITDQLHGLQVGLVNYAANSDVYKILPIVNWQF